MNPASDTQSGSGSEQYPVRFGVAYPDRPLNRLSSAFRIITVIPILIVLALVTTSAGNHLGAAAGILFLAPLVMILFRKKYPRWWFDWNVELLRFINRVSIYLSLMDDKYPSTDEQQSVRLDIDYPDAERDLQRGMPLVKWILALPHYVILIFLQIAALVAVIISWFAILFTGRYPRSLFDFVEGVFRWHMRVTGYMFILVTDKYPPFSLDG